MTIERKAMSAAKSTYQAVHILHPAFVYTPAAATNIAATFARIRAHPRRPGAAAGERGEDQSGEEGMKQYVVTMVCKVRKSVTCEGGTEEQILADPWSYVVDEQEVEQIDWDITDIKEDR